jgi:hypothetical protein
MVSGGTGLYGPHKLRHQLRLGSRAYGVPSRVQPLSASGKTYCASSAYMRPRSSGECSSSIAIRAIPSIGLQPRESSRAEISCVFRFGVPAVLPPVCVVSPSTRVYLRPIIS